LKITAWKTSLKAFSTSTCITTQSGCRSKRALMSKGIVSQPLGVKTPNSWGDRCSWNSLWSCRTMEQLISQKDTSFTAIGQRPSVPFTIANNMLTPNTKATNLGISPWTTIGTMYNNLENFKDGSYGMKHLKICS
jgi:hypothetical protein